MTACPDVLRERPLYRAPALEKGLEVLELLSGQSAPLNATTIMQRLGRTSGELFRIIQVLEGRGYIAQGRWGYTLTNRLFELGMAQPPSRDRIEVALPVMRALASQEQQSCHLALALGGDMVVMARVESPAQIGFSVRVGYRRPLHRSTSGMTLLAFQPTDRQAAWERLFQPTPDATELSTLRDLCRTIRAQGFADMPSRYTAGVHDLAVPILHAGNAAAVIAMPFLQPLETVRTRPDAIAALVAAAEEISGALAPHDGA
ncbi:helix-turn-helix domain-containing protein [Novosphingobium sp.]|uniref:IclR family transcriptional regulator n=1 Tax=Novosphingobium sp. TaxID=1874826 RepID=UPI002615D93D|nr:helix-turn-helix domain-containing protein [Novosphingobium sp.]